jgi:hypothetical protein
VPVLLLVSCAEVPMRPDDPRVRAVAAALVGLVDALSIERDAGPGVDELLAFPFGLERRAASALVRRGTIATVRLGRRLYARRSDLLALVQLTPEPTEPPAVVGAAEAARAAYARPLRVVGGRR